MGILKAMVLTFEGTGEMHSQIPRALHKILGKSMLHICIDTLKELGVAECIVLGEVRDEIDGVVFVGNCGKSTDITDGLHYIGEDDTIIVLDASMPLITKEVLRELLETHAKSDRNMTVANSYRGYGAGFYCFSGELLRRTLLCVSEDFPDNKYELQSLGTAARSMGIVPKEYISDSRYAFLRVKNRADLAHATGILKEKINILHMLQGVTIVDPSNTYIGPDVVIDHDTIIYPGCIIEGVTSIGRSCEIGPNTRLSDVILGDNTNISSSVAYKSKIGSHCEIGPFAYIRPGSDIGNHVKIGDFVEVKNSIIGDNTKASHLTYIGDADVGSNINFGCGTITGNYDGVNKHRTTIKDNAFIGCNSSLIAPVTVGEGAYVAAGSTVTEDVPSKALGIARARQINKPNWRKPHNG